MSAGPYQLCATVHAEPDLGGAALQTLAVAFTVVAAPVFTDATLRSLTLDGVTLAPSFGGTTERYTASVGHGMTSVTVATMPTDANATVVFHPAADADPGAPGHQVALAVGDTAITVTVTRAGGPAVEVSFGQAAYSAAEGRAVAAVRVRLSAEPERAVTVALTASGAGGATAGDWSLAPASVTFSSGETSPPTSIAEAGPPRIAPASRPYRATVEDAARHRHPQSSALVDQWIDGFGAAVHASLPTPAR